MTILTMTIHYFKDLLEYNFVWEDGMGCSVEK